MLRFMIILSITTRGLGLTVYNANNVSMWGNIVYGNGQGLSLSVDTTMAGETANGNKVFNNTFYKNYNTYYNRCDGHYVETWIHASVTNATVENNIFYASDNSLLYYFTNRGNTGNVIDYNIVFKDAGIGTNSIIASPNWQSLTQWKSLGFDQHSISYNPLFGNPSTFDFFLDAGSPAINNGINVGLTTDYAGSVYPALGNYDIGAYEYVSTPAGTSAPQVISASSSSGGTISPSGSVNVGIQRQPDIHYCSQYRLCHPGRDSRRDKCRCRVKLYIQQCNG